jgi:hypothetical protein
MTIWVRSALGTVLGAAGLLGIVTASILGRPTVLWGSLGVAAAGAALVAWAFRDAIRAIGDARTRCDAQLRAWVDSGKKDPPPSA